ncbi:membrane protein [Thermococcus guaymasensis DSM 11113]|uniref:Membrane protein n=1 Tax=Thermococcus guaymasensis DSM 11113 TaxID=1432656 RepID=A0A0X1KJ83_9EURY|nr:hypothetical protein [Thermococcus guaymasensis]AJC71323.1 membrane protein [Thermococcus guaymasensis DSM 11113]
MIETVVGVAVAASCIIITIFLTKKLGPEWAWINRKLIHFSIVPAILLFYYGIIPREIFSPAAALFGIAQLATHLKHKELSWYQLNHNYGEVFFAFSASAIVAFLPRDYATALLLVMAISDGITGVVRHFYFRRNGLRVKLKKHWTGSLAYLATALVIAFVFLNGDAIRKVVWAVVLMLAEYQPWVDDNLAVPLIGGLLFPFY